MINMLLAQTLEVDEQELALRDILLQLDLKRNLKKYSVGIIHCNQSFIDSGVVKTICERLPFPVLGMNTLLHSSALGLIDNMLLTLCILTSEDVKFATGLSQPLIGNSRSGIVDTYVETENLMSSRPGMGLVFGPAMTTCAIGEMLVDILNETSDGVPFWCFSSRLFYTYKKPQDHLQW
jgi:hypothetical protein